MMIFEPGFSTAEKVTEISGRGVGMDVVRRNIEGLRGSISIASEPGRGATFQIKMPLTLAVLDGLIVGVGKERFVMPTTAVRESLRPTPSQVHKVQDQPRLVQVRDSVLPLVALGDIFRLPHQSDPSQATVIVIEDGGARVGLVVDALLGKQEVVIKSRFTRAYIDQHIFEADPFVTIDVDGVGELVRIGTERGRAVRRKLKVGICGEHGGDPASIAFCEQADLDYVSCSPYRVPIARLAAAQAALAARAGESVSKVATTA